MSNHKLLRYFEYGHLPDHLKGMSQRFHSVAHSMANEFEDGDDPAEFTTALRKLLEAKDCAVRSKLRW